VAGNGIGMPMAPELGRRLPMAGLALLLAGTGSIRVVVARNPHGLTPWQLIVPVFLYGAGLGLGAASLMLIRQGGAELCGSVPERLSRDRVDMRLGAIEHGESGVQPIEGQCQVGASQQDNLRALVVH
jgi:hypothetical protein